MGTGARLSSGVQWCSPSEESLGVDIVCVCFSWGLASAHGVAKFGAHRSCVCRAKVNVFRLRIYIAVGNSRAW